MMIDPQTRSGGRSSGGAPSHPGHPHGSRRADPVVTAGPPEEAPAESAAEQYRAIAEVTADWAYALHIEPDGRAITDWMSTDVQQVTGFTPTELGPVDAWLRMVHREDRELMRSHLRALQAGRADTVEYRVVTGSGETRWVRDYARPMAHPVHGAVYVVGGVRDITARRQAEMDRARLLTECEVAENERNRLVRSVRRALAGADVELRDSATVLERLAAGDGSDPDALRDHAMRIGRVVDVLTALLEDLDGPADQD